MDEIVWYVGVPDPHENGTPNTWLRIGGYKTYWCIRAYCGRHSAVRYVERKEYETLRDELFDDEEDAKAFLVALWQLTKGEVDGSTHVA